MTLADQLAEVAALRNRLYWEFTRGKNSPPVPAEVSRKFYELTEKIRAEKFKKPPCPRCGRCGFIEDADMNLAGVCPECKGTGCATPPALTRRATFLCQPNQTSQGARRRQPPPRSSQPQSA